MDFRVVWLSGLVVGTAAVAGACDAPDPGEITYSERSKAESSSSGGGSSSSGASSSSSGASGGTDGGGSSSGEGGAADPVFGTSQFAAGNPGQNANQVGDHAGQTPLEGKNCVVAGCHLDNNKKWGFAGTVYAAATGGTTVKNAEVRVTGPDGATIGMTYTDDNGNFWYEGARPPANSRVGVRDGTKKAVMVGTVAGDSGAGCNAPACHGNAAMRIYLQ